MSIIDINNRLMDFLLKEPSDWSVFNLKNHLIGNIDIVLKRTCKFAASVDETGGLGLIYLSVLCRRQIGETVASVEKILENPERLKPYQDCFALINSPEAQEVRAGLVRRITKIAAAVSRGRLIGDNKGFADAIDDAVEAIFTNFPNLHFEVYIKSGRPVEGFTNFSSSVQVCDSLAEMLLRLEKSPDGIYVGYVSNPGTLDGWFGFFCKSNGNMFSYHERIDEKYVGQHRNMRNGRYTDSKAFDLFPYELCEFSDKRDYKGYSTEVKMGDQRKFLDATNFPVFVRTILAMAIISNRHAGHMVSGTPVIVNSLLASNLALLENRKEKTTALVKWEGSPLVKVSSSFKTPKFEVEKLLRGDYNAEFCNTGKGSQEGRGWFYGFNQDMVDAYGDGFEYKQEEVLASNSSRRLLGDANTEQEFIGSPERMRLSAYYKVREQLAIYIRKQMKDDYKRFGGRDGLMEWYAAALKKCMDKILAYCADAYDKSVASGETTVRYGAEERQEKGFKCTMTESFFAKNSPIRIVILKKPPFSPVALSIEENKYICPLTGSYATVYFKFEFSTYKQVQEFLGADLPKFCIGWKDNPDYNGNSILDVTDPVGNIISPISRKCGWLASFDFTFAIGLNKRGLAKIKRTIVGEKAETPDKKESKETK